jgi:glycogen phosphorylase
LPGSRSICAAPASTPVSKVWRTLDPVLWDLTHNPWAVLWTASREHIQRLPADPAFRGRVDELQCLRHEAQSKPGWFQRQHAHSPLKAVAYFSMEFMLSEALPMYSGGLGNVAGDQLKAASDLGVPGFGIGLLYSQGYFRQVIDANGGQQAMYPFNDPGQLPIVPLRGPNGDWLRL